MIDVLQKLGDNYYVPAFFRMKVGTKDSLLDLNKLDERVFLFYYHEYIHFLQDVTTTYGLMHISNVSYYIRDAVYCIEHGGQKKFSYPHKIQQKGDFGYANHRMWRVYSGSPIEPMYEKVSVDKIDPQKIQVLGADLESVFIDITDLKTGTQYPYLVFGASVLKESMAYLCEHYVYEPVYKRYGTPYPAAPDYPYNICTKIAEKLYPEIAAWPPVLVGICDMSLMNYNPGLMYIRLIEHFKSIALHEKCDDFSSINDFIAYLYKEGLSFISGHQYDFDQMQQYVASEMDEYFKCEQFEGNNRWVNTVLNRAAELRSKIPQFMVDIMLYGQGQDVRQNRCFAEIFKYLGSPLIFNDNDEASFNPPSGFDTTHFMPELFWAIQQLFGIFQEGKSRLPCQLKNHCLISQPKGVSVVDGRCVNAPWDRSCDANLCPFAIMWRHWGLTGYEPQ